MDDRLDAITSLGEPTRRSVYEFVVAHGGWVSRDQTADGVGLERGTAAHHLDRLAADGLLEVDFQRVSGRQGPGAGRPAKLYRRAVRDFGVSLPPRDYELAGRLLADAADRSRVAGVPITNALDDAAQEEGVRLGEEMRARVRGSAGRRAGRSVSARRRAVLEVLGERGFEPRATEEGTVVLSNCPFHKLARQHTDLICGMNLCLLEAAINQVENSGFHARLEPEEGFCCVKLHPALDQARVKKPA